jgi:cytochrome c553
LPEHPEQETMNKKRQERKAIPVAFLSKMWMAGCALLVLQNGAFAQGALPAAAHDAHDAQGENIARAGIPPSVPACVACHGAAGEGNAASGCPRLAGLPAGYLAEQLADFASGARRNAVMSPIANALSADARASVARYFASLPVPAAAAQEPTQSAAPQAGATGEALALNGDWKNDVPACVSCHGDQGSGIGDHFPALTGQPASYLRAQLAAWKSGTRAPGPLGLMGSIARKLSDTQADAVAAYFASLPSSAQRVSQDSIHGAAQ